MKKCKIMEEESEGEKKNNRQCIKKSLEKIKNLEECKKSNE